MSEPSRPISTDEQGFYRVEKELTPGQCECPACLYWTIVYDGKDEPMGISTSWQGEAGRETAGDICDLMNMAYDAGREKLEPVLQLASELCDAVDAEDQDIGGHRRSRDILGDLGPAVEAAK